MITILFYWYCAFVSTEILAQTFFGSEPLAHTYSIVARDPETGEIPEKKKEFNDQVNVILKGKKLSELTKIDKVGKSTLTTDAFNSVIDELKAQL